MALAQVWRDGGLDAVALAEEGLGVEVEGAKQVAYCSQQHKKMLSVASMCLQAQYRSRYHSKHGM